MEMLLELYSLTLENVLESQGLDITDLDSGKWYQRKTDNNH